MSEPGHCTSCGFQLDPSGPGGLCPVCLLKMGLKASAATASAEAAAVPADIGPYHLLQALGEGGMGLVYLAEQREPLVRRVALKLIKPGMDTREVLARFEAERQVLALMDHPNIGAGPPAVTGPADDGTGAPADLIRACAHGSRARPTRMALLHGRGLGPRLAGRDVRHRRRHLMSVAWNDYLGRYVAVYTPLVSSLIFVRTADRPEGPWSEEIIIEGIPPTVGFPWISSGVGHAELAREGGRVGHRHERRELETVGPESLRDRVVSTVQQAARVRPAPPHAARVCWWLPQASTPTRRLTPSAFRRRRSGCA